MASADLLLHPVRLRIVQAFLGDRTRTVGELAAELPDVPTASLYRHVARLADAGVLVVAAERRVRAVVERTYTLRAGAARIEPGGAAAATPAQHLAGFMAHAAGMLADAERYLTTGAPDPARDGAGCSTAAMWLTDAELADLARDLAAVVRSRLANAPARGRRQHVLHRALVPLPETTTGRAAAATRATRATRATGSKTEHTVRGAGVTCAPWALEPRRPRKRRENR